MAAHIIIYRTYVMCNRGIEHLIYLALIYMQCFIDPTTCCSFSNLAANCVKHLKHSRQDQENSSAQANESDPSTVPNEEDDVFSGLDDVPGQCIFYHPDSLNEINAKKPKISCRLPVEARTTLDNNIDRDDLLKKIVRPPANLLVFEGDCMDSEASELELYLVTFYLLTCNYGMLLFISLTESGISILYCS